MMIFSAPQVELVSAQDMTLLPSALPMPETIVDSSLKRTRPTPITRRAWERHKPIIMDLYQPDSGMTLRDIVQWMGDNHGFWATSDYTNFPSEVDVLTGW